MPVPPSVKGSVVAGHAELLNKYLAENKVTPATLAARFPDGELDVLSKPIATSGWYDVRLYQRLLEFLRDYIGKGSNGYLIGLGERSAERLLSAGMYQQMEYLNRLQLTGTRGAEERFRAFGRDLRMMKTLGSSIFNFIESVVREDPDHKHRWLLEYPNAEAFPEVACWTTQGFNNRMAAVHGAKELWIWDRPRPDLVLFRMTRPA